MSDDGKMQSLGDATRDFSLSVESANFPTARRVCF